MEDIQFLLDEAREMMEKGVSHVMSELSKIRAGKATPSMLDSIKIDYYGNLTPLNQTATINTPDAKTLIIRPWEKSIIADIERGINNSDLGLNPQNDGEQIIINIPALTEERRIELVKHAKHECEQGKISLRNTRHDILHHIKELKNEGASEDNIKLGENTIQELINEFSKKIDEIIASKEADIMTV